jgi:hypothetical protein
VSYLGILDNSDDNMINWKKYFMRDKLNDDNILKFLDDFNENKLTPYFASEERNSGGQLTFDNINFVFGNEFDSKVMETETDFLIMFYQDICAQCNELADVFIEFMNNHKHNKIYFAVFNPEYNDNKYILNDDLPEVYLFKKEDKKNPIKLPEKYKVYEGIGYFLRENIKGFEYVERKHNEKKNANADKEEVKKDL